jgi:hypothetical protein
MRYQWNPHCGAKQRARNLRRAQQAALQEQREGCDWLTDTQSLPGAPARHRGHAAPSRIETRSDVMYPAMATNAPAVDENGGRAGDGCSPRSSEAADGYVPCTIQLRDVDPPLKRSASTSAVLLDVVEDGVAPREG